MAELEIRCAVCGELITKEITKQTDTYWVSYHRCEPKLKGNPYTPYKVRREHRFSRNDKI